jgi:hypothetical protein
MNRYKKTGNGRPHLMTSRDLVGFECRLKWILGKKTLNYNKLEVGLVEWLKW